MEKLTVILLAIGIIILACLIIAWPVQWLWNNCLLNAVDGINTITFWQALGISLLFSILFKSSNINTKN